MLFYPLCLGGPPQRPQSITGLFFTADYRRLSSTSSNFSNSFNSSNFSNSFNSSNFSNFSNSFNSSNFSNSSNSFPNFFPQFLA